MKFGEKLIQLRRSVKLTQSEVAERIGVTLRTYQNYETGGLYPKKTDVYGRIAVLFDVTTDYLLSDEDKYIIDAAGKGGSKSKKDIQALIADVGGLFAGGELSDDDKDKVMRTINDLYWKAKENNKKYTPKKYREEQAK